MPSTVQFNRVLRTTPERLYRAFIDPDAMVKWLPPNGFTAKVHHMDARVGGTYKMSFTNFSSGKSHSFGGEYLELVPTRTHSLDRSVRRSEPAWRDDSDREFEEGLRRDGSEHRAGGDPGCHPAGRLHSWLAGITRSAGEARRGGDSGLTSAEVCLFNSLRAQRGQRVHATGAPRRQIGGQPCSDAEHERGTDQGDRIERPDTKEQRREEPCREQRRDYTDRPADQHQSHAVRREQLRDAGPRSAPSAMRIPTSRLRLATV